MCGKIICKQNAIARWIWDDDDDEKEKERKSSLYTNKPIPSLLPLISDIAIHVYVYIHGEASVRHEPRYPSSSMRSARAEDTVLILDDDSF